MWEKGWVQHCVLHTVYEVDTWEMHNYEKSNLVPMLESNLNQTTLTCEPVSSVVKHIGAGGQGFDSPAS